MDSYKEYNRLRKNLLQRARYHNIKNLNIPTARQIAVKGKVTKKQFETLSKESRRLSKEVKATKIISSVRVATLRQPHKKADIPQSKRKTKSTTLPKTTFEVSSANNYEYDENEYYYNEAREERIRDVAKNYYIDIYKKYGSQFTSVTTEGRIIDLYTGEDLGSALTADARELGKYIDTYYYSTDENKITPPKTHTALPLSESVMFYSFIQQRIDIAFNDYLNRSNGGRKGSSLDGIHQIQSALNSMKAEDLTSAIERYNAYSDEIKNYLDDALYYTSIQDDHYRALEIIMDLMLSPVEAATAKEIIANHSEELIFSESGDEIIQNPESIYG